MASPKTVPKDAQVMIQILKDMGITEYEPRVINQMLEFTYRYVTTIIEDAKIYATHAKKNIVDADDIRLAIQCRMDQSFTSPPPRDFLLDVARQKNQTPLPLIKPYTGPRLPPDRYCLTAPNYRLKSIQKKVASCVLICGENNSASPQYRSCVQQAQHAYAWHSLSAVSHDQSGDASVTVGAALQPTPSTPMVQNVLINPSLIGSKKILITTNMVSQNSASESLKRKHEDDDDYDAL
ncbi:unnamed protein product [Coregonus sp. 'balchen']|nr:unnamed protein product [Coregonus sp. 'balchen']